MVSRGSVLSGDGGPIPNHVPRSPAANRRSTTPMTNDARREAAAYRRLPSNTLVERIAKAEQAGDTSAALGLKSLLLAELHREQDAAAAGAAHPTHPTTTLKETA